MSTIYAIHTPNPAGAPMNETAACEKHLEEYRDDGMGLARDADDAPQELVYSPVAAPENNDTVCQVCRAEDEVSKLLG